MQRQFCKTINKKNKHNHKKTIPISVNLPVRVMPAGQILGGMVRALAIFLPSDHSAAAYIA